MSENGTTESLKITPLHALHNKLGAKMVPFAGYDMPVQFPMGVLQEHLQTRAHAGLFDVSHMGQAFLRGREGTIAAFEQLVPGDIAGLKPGRMRYTQLTSETGGILDDLMVTRLADEAGMENLFLVVNAACKEQDLKHIAEHLQGRADVTRLEDRALIALQGQQAATAFARLLPEVVEMGFMTWRKLPSSHGELYVSRSGYTGEDGFEISVPARAAEALAEELLTMDEVAPIGLGARDSLRLEAGLCLYGHDIDETTSPVEADLVWSIGKRRRKDGGFIGAERILRELREGPTRKRVVFNRAHERPRARAPRFKPLTARPSAPLLAVASDQP